MFFAIVLGLLCFDDLSISEAFLGGVPRERKNMILAFYINRC